MEPPKQPLEYARPPRRRYPPIVKWTELAFAAIFLGILLCAFIAWLYFRY
jgi:hypothetical protein